MSRGSLFVVSFSTTSHIFSYFSRMYHTCYQNSRLNLHYHTRNFLAKPICNNIKACHHQPMRKIMHLNCLSTAASSQIYKSPINMQSNKSKKKAHRESPEGILRFKLDMCSKNGDLVEALRLYNEARNNAVPLSLHHYNVLLYLCSSGNSNDSNASRDNSNGSTLGFEIFRRMVSEKVCPNEATFTSVARLAAVVNDPDMAFDLVKQMKTFGIPPKLRSYGPALFGFCKKGDTNQAYQVDAHMSESGVIPEEPELSALLKLSAHKEKVDKVYEMLHRLRASVRQVSECSLEIIEDWFNSESAINMGYENWDVNKVKDGVLRGGGGWHGQGWLGGGKWRAVRTPIDENGVCQSCGEKLVCIDIDPGETENFATSLANLVCKREKKSDFVKFQVSKASNDLRLIYLGVTEQGWLRQHGPFDAVIDGANVGLVNSHNFSFSQLKDVVNQFRQMSPTKKLPLVILNTGRVTGGPAQHPNNKKLLESWKKSGALYATPLGSNDDWYWLYAAVSSKCLLLTNDEMRDHLFQLLGTSFFPRWKEKHQVRLSVSREGIKLILPPPYSTVIQESENGSWHVPAFTSNDLETPRQWLCATRARKASVNKLVNLFNS